MRKTMWFLLAVTAAVVAQAPSGGGAVTCNTVANDLSPCVNFVLYGGVAAPPLSCCEGIRSLYNEATTAGDRQAVCSCLKSVASTATPSMISNAAALPSKCGVSIPYKISPSTDCSTVH